MEQGPRVRRCERLQTVHRIRTFPAQPTFVRRNRTDGGRVGFVENAIMNPVRVLGLAALATLASLSGAQAQEPPTGTWLTEGGEIRVRIAKCASAYCGTIVWERKESQVTNNPDPALRSRKMIGVQLLTDLKPNDEGGYTGNVYNPRDGRTYTAKVKLKSADALELSGCLLAVLCQSQTWTRVAEQRPQTRG
jgi:uncharacterized protein (DUF2147 family)